MQRGEHIALTIGILLQHHQKIQKSRSTKRLANHQSTNIILSGEIYQLHYKYTTQIIEVRFADFFFPVNLGWLWFHQSCIERETFMLFIPLGTLNKRTLLSWKHNSNDVSRLCEVKQVQNSRIVNSTAAICITNKATILL